MITIDDYEDDPYRAVQDFEEAMANYVGSRYAVATDSCTHAMELCLRLLAPSHISLPKHTYINVVMLMHMLGIEYDLVDDDWYNHLEYNLTGSPIWDSARKLEYQMHKPFSMECISFGHTKPLEIGRGGMIFVDDDNVYEWLKRASYDGRNLAWSNWGKQSFYSVGYHYMMRPEEAIDGLNILDGGCFNEQHGKFNYPDVSGLIIK